MKRWLVFGLTGQVGVALREALVPGDAHVLAVSRSAQADGPGVTWLRGDLGAWDAPTETYDALVSLGPLDVFARWFEARGPVARRVVALGSTSVHSKSDSPDAAERDLAARLSAAEDRLAAACAGRGADLAVLRPTLIYGLGRDRNLSRIVGFARRWRIVPLPRSATGLRQPVHAADVAAAALAAARAPEPRPGRFDLPGGETLPYDEMVRRALAAGAPGARLLRVPDPVFRTGLRLARGTGRLADAGDGMLLRLSQDLAYDLAPAREALGYSPRPFQPSAGMFEP